MFVDPDDLMVQYAVASLLYDMIHAGGIESNLELQRFSEIMRFEFELNDVDSRQIYTLVKDFSGSLDEDLQIIKDEFLPFPKIRVKFFTKLEQLMRIDGIHAKELELFKKVRLALLR